MKKAIVECDECHKLSETKIPDSLEEDEWTGDSCNKCNKGGSLIVLEIL
jgi:hypothetical protein